MRTFHNSGNLCDQPGYLPSDVQIIMRNRTFVSYGKIQRVVVWGSLALSNLKILTGPAYIIISFSMFVNSTKRKVPFDQTKPFRIEKFLPVGRIFWWRQTRVLNTIILSLLSWFKFVDDEFLLYGFYCCCFFPIVHFFKSPFIKICQIVVEFSHDIVLLRKIFILTINTKEWERHRETKWNVVEEHQNTLSSLQVYFDY